MSIVIVDNSGVFKNKGKHEYHYVRRSNRDFKYKYFTMNETILSPDTELHINTDTDPDHSLRITNALNPTIYISYSGDPIIELVDAEHKILISYFYESEKPVFNVVYRDKILIIDDSLIESFIGKTGYRNISKDEFRRNQVQVFVSALIADIIQPSCGLTALPS